MSATLEQLERLSAAAVSVLWRDRSADADAVRDGLNRLIAAARVREQSTRDLATKPAVRGPESSAIDIAARRWPDGAK